MLFPIASLAQNATTFAILYGYPLLSYSNLASKIAGNSSEFSVNTFYHQKQLASAGFSDINRPNVDTLYSEALVDLSSQDLVVTIPEVPSDRFYVFPFYDVYGNNVVNIGTAGISNTPGRYLVGYRPSDPGYKPGDKSYAGYIYLPTPYDAIDLRIQVNGPDDVSKVNALQAQFHLKTIPRPVRFAPKLTKSLLLDGLSTDGAEKLLQLTARLSPYNPPEVKTEIPKVASQLQLAGLSRGSYKTPSGVNLTRALADAVTAITAVPHAQFSTYFDKLGNDWSQLRNNYSGDFKQYYNVRAFIASQGYLQLKPDQAIYPVYDVSTQLTSDKSFNITFSGKPPVNGFWSLTVYDSQAFLVPNSWNIYSVSDRSGIKYPNGTPVYPTSGSSGDDGEFSILLQTQDVPPPENYRSNWIPTPSLNASSTRFGFNLRWYGPTEDLQNGAYVYPKVVALSQPLTA